jgi:hypothetical protein
MVPRLQQAIGGTRKVERKCPVLWQHSEKCDVCTRNIAVLSCGMQYAVMEKMVLCVTFTFVHEVTLSVEDWQIYIFGWET